MLLRLVVVIGDVVVNPDPTGMPGGALIQRLLNWSQALALWGSLGAILIGAAIIVAAVAFIVTREGARQRAARASAAPRASASEAD